MLLPRPRAALLASPNTKCRLILGIARLPILSTHQAEKAKFKWVVIGLRTLGQKKEDLPRGRAAKQRAEIAVCGVEGFSDLENHLKTLWNQRYYRGMHMARNPGFRVLTGHISSLEPRLLVFCLFLKIELFSYNLGFVLFFKDVF